MRKLVFGLSLAGLLAAQPPPAQAASELMLRFDFGGYGHLHESFSARKMIGGAIVLDSKGNRVGHVTDLLVEGDGAIESLVIRGGGVLGIGTTVFAYPWDKAMIARPDLIKLPFDSGIIASYKDRFGDLREQDVPAGLYRLRDFLDDTVFVRGGHLRLGYVEDAVLDAGGHVLGLVLDPDPAATRNSALHVMPFIVDREAGYDWDGERYTVPHGPEEVVRLDVFRQQIKELRQASQARSE